AGAVGSAAKGGGVLALLWTSFRVASVTPTTVPTAAAAASATMIQTLARALIPGDASSPCKAIFPEAMASYRELLQQTRAEISEVDATQARDRIESGEPVVVDVREQDEWDEGHIPGAVHV